MKTTSKLATGTTAGITSLVLTKSQALGATVMTMVNTGLKVLNGAWELVKLVSVPPIMKSIVS